MKLSVGMMVTDSSRVRWRVTSFTGGLVSMRRVEYRPSLFHRNEMVWADTEETRDMIRGNFEILFHEVEP